MLEIANERIFFGDFHGQWNEGPDTLPVLLAGLTFYGYDFSVFQGPGDSTPQGPLMTLVRDLEVNLTVFPNGRELFWDWGHVTTAGLRNREALPPLDEPDYVKVLGQVKAQCDFCALAHPYPPMWDKLDQLLDQNLVDAIELVNGHGRDDPEHELFKWYNRRIASGRTTPIVSGLDIHISRGSQRPPIIFNADNPPATDITLLTGNYCLVLCESCEPECVFAAVREGRSLIEHRGRLIGPPDLVRKLTDAGYFEAREKAQEEREALVLQIDGHARPVAMQGLPLKVRGAETATAIYWSEDKGVRCDEFNDQGRLEIKSVPALRDSNLFYAPVRVKTADNRGRMFALKVHEALWIDLQPRPAPAGKAAEQQVSLVLRNNADQPAQGTYTIRCEQCPQWSANGTFGPIPSLHAQELLCALPAMDNPHLARTFVADIFPGHGRHRTLNKDLVFLAIPRAHEAGEAEWRNCPPIRMDRRELLDPHFTGEWGGPDDCSAEFRILWNREGLHFRIMVTDDILHPSPRPHQLMFGDSIQIGLNPLNREDVPGFSFYDIVMTRGADTGNERCNIRLAPHLAVEGIQKNDLYLPDSCFKVARVAETLVRVELHLPWSLLIPMQPLPGYRFGLYFYLWDNDGTGLKSAMTWPRPNPDHAWYVPDGAGWALAELSG